MVGEELELAAMRFAPGAPHPAFGGLLPASGAKGNTPDLVAPADPRIVDSRGAPSYTRGLAGAVAQMGERCNRTAEASGSIPLSSTKLILAVPYLTTDACEPGRLIDAARVH